MIDPSKFNSVSELAHFFLYSLRKPKTQLEKGMLIISIDIDAGSPELGIINEGKRDNDVNLRLSEYQIGKIEELSLPLFVEVFDEIGIPVSFAIRGQLTEVDSQFMKILLNTRIKHDIGAHGYYHTQFTQLTSSEAETELQMVSTGFKKYGIIPKTFIFPRNCIAHLDLLEKHEYICYRGYGNLTKDCMRIDRFGQLYNIHPSLFADKHSSLLMLKSMLNMSIEKRLPFHIWFHFWSFGEDEKSISKSINRVFAPFLDYAKEKQEDELLTFETMLSAAQKIHAHSHI